MNLNKTKIKKATEIRENETNTEIVNDMNSKYN